MPRLKGGSQLARCADDWVMTCTHMMDAHRVLAVHVWCKANKPRLLKEKQAYLSQVIKGHCAYYERTGNGKRLGNFRFQVVRARKMALSRRNRDGRLNAILRDSHCRMPRSIDLCYLSEPVA